MNSRPFLKQLRCNHRAEQQNQQAQRHQSTLGNVVCCRKFLPSEPQQGATKQNFEGHGHLLLNNLESNWAYMVMASLAWSLKCWAASSDGDIAFLKTAGTNYGEKSLFPHAEFASIGRGKSKAMTSPRTPKCVPSLWSAPTCRSFGFARVRRCVRCSVGVSRRLH